MIFSDSESLYNSLFLSDFFLHFYLMYLRELSKDTEIYIGALDNYLDLEKFFKCFEGTKPEISLEYL